MNTQQIQTILNNHIDSNIILSTDIEINEHNDQIQNIKIIFKPDSPWTPLDKVGNIIDEIDNLTTADEYGDMVELSFKYSTFHDLPNDDLTVSWEFNISIDS